MFRFCSVSSHPDLQDPDPAEEPEHEGGRQAPGRGVPPPRLRRPGEAQGGDEGAGGDGEGDGGVLLRGPELVQAGGVLQVPLGVLCQVQKGISTPFSLSNASLLRPLVVSSRKCFFSPLPFLSLASVALSSCRQRSFIHLTFLLLPPSLFFLPPERIWNQSRKWGASSSLLPWPIRATHFDFLAIFNNEIRCFESQAVADNSARREQEALAAQRRAQREAEDAGKKKLGPSVSAGAAGPKGERQIQTIVLKIQYISPLMQGRV